MGNRPPAPQSAIEYGAHSLALRQLFENEILPRISIMEGLASEIASQGKADFGVPQFSKGKTLAALNDIRGGYASVLVAHEAGSRRLGRYYRTPNDEQLLSVDVSIPKTKGGGGGGGR